MARPKLNSGWILVTRVMAITCAVILFITAVLQFWDIEDVNKDNFDKFIIAGYLAFFGLVIVVAEFTAICFFKYLRFYFNFVGRGLFFVLCGTLMLGLAHNFSLWIGIVLGSFVSFVGICFLLIACLTRKEHGPRPIFFESD
ncbi:hypothetical protein QOT17_012829 [Balamuthia mandrillaris]